MQFGICNEIFQGWTLPDTFAYAARAGYDLVEIAPFTIARSVTEISAAQRAELRESAARAGVGIAGLHWVLVETAGMFLNSPDAETRRRSARYFEELVACCADFGGTRIVVGSPKQRQVAAGTSHEAARVWTAETLRDAVRRAEDRGVVVCLEPLAPNETNFLNTAAEARRFAAEFASPALSVILDVKAMCAEAQPIPQIIRESAGQFAYFHANDRNLKGPGFGDVDFTPIAAALREVRYDGVVSVEVFNFDEGPEVIATRSREYLRGIFG
ncbi:MAG: sugar phosphate isomerase/epimerase [Chthoniobacter sp.]|nr:sugar phosphate isomerase/epimerase [Chthoniobacter sp.]